MDMLIVFLIVSIVNASPAFSNSKMSDDYVPCDRGWYYFRDKCYLVGGRRQSERLSWTEALARCKNSGADLASIHSQEEQDFLTALLLQRVKWWSWIGLNDRDKEGDFRWTDGSAYNYSNWEQYLPTTRNASHVNDCVQFLLYPEVGQWSNINCNRNYAYVCKKTTNFRKRSPNMMYCSPEEGGGWKYETSCFHIVTEKKSWQNAERHCKINYNGHLLTIRDTLEDYFLELAVPDIRKEMWIGIKIQNQLQQKWTSSWYVSYERFNKDERYVDGTCVARKNRQEWITMPCSRKLPFICEVSKENPPVLKNPPKGAHCPKELDDWRDLGGEFCYYIETTKNVTFSEAHFDCKRRGGDLVSLHSQEESEILHPFIEHKKNWVYIGLIRLFENNEEKFGWLDGSKLDYQNWDHNEPKGNGNCVHVFTIDMRWRINSCVPEALGYICSVKKIVPDSSEKTSDCKNYCVAPHSYLDGLLNQCPDAKEIL